MSDNSENLISGIYNYCDRWCEKCKFSARCRVFAKEQQYTDEERDIENEAFWRRIAANFADAKEGIIKLAEEHDLDPDAVSDDEFAEIQRREREFIDACDLPELAERYAKEARIVLENEQDWLIFAPLDDVAKEEMLEIIYWYQFFIAVKIQGGLHGLLDFEGNYDETEMNDPQSDANGSIKVALIAVERSILAWSSLLAEENAELLDPLISLLKNICRKTEKKFPNAFDFIRPGFDEIETVM
jgi:hypothetical protein